jgi:hypothetical protein
VGRSVSLAFEGHSAQDPLQTRWTSWQQEPQTVPAPVLFITRATSPPAKMASWRNCRSLIPRHRQTIMGFDPSIPNENDYQYHSRWNTATIITQT